MTAELPVEYFCICFVCGASGLCAHRETDLVVWWQSMGRLPVRHVHGNAGPRPIPYIAVIPKRIEVEPEPALKSPQDKPIRKPFTRADHLKAGSRYAKVYDEARGW